MIDKLSSRHADMRAMQRLADEPRTMTELWESSQPCEVKYRSYDEARYDFVNNVVMFKKGNKITTILHAESEEVTLNGTDDNRKA